MRFSRNIEVFEAVTQANPDDFQSLEILKEAYWKVGRKAEGIGTSRRLADAYMRLGQYSSALLEFEGILQQDPDAEDIRQILSELEVRLHRNTETPIKAAIALDYGFEVTGLTRLDGTPLAPTAGAVPAVPSVNGIRVTPIVPPAPPEGYEPSLMSMGGRPGRQGNGAASRKAAFVSLDADGNEPMSKFLIQHRLASHDVINSALQKVADYNTGLEAGKDISVAIGRDD